MRKMWKIIFMSVLLLCSCGKGNTEVANSPAPTENPTRPEGIPDKQTENTSMAFSVDSAACGEVPGKDTIDGKITNSIWLKITLHNETSEDIDAINLYGYSYDKDGNEIEQISLLIQSLTANGVASEGPESIGICTMENFGGFVIEEYGIMKKASESSFEEILHSRLAPPIDIPVDQMGLLVID